MKRSLKHLPKEKQKEIEEIKKYILENLPVEMIILFGSYARGDWVEDKYVENGTTYEYKSDYDILIVVDSETRAQHNNRFASGIKRKISRNCDIETAVNVIYHGIDYLNSEIEDGNYFFTDILKEGVRIHHSKRFVLSQPSVPTESDRLRKAEEHFEKWFEHANVFFEDFESNMLKSGKGQVYLNQAAFLLHQSTEKFFMTVLLVFTDYRPKTHDLEEIILKINKHDARFKNIFPRKTKEQERLFMLLKKAYIDARYKMGYNIQKEELEYLALCVEKLKTLTETVCKEKIEQLRRG